MAEGGSEVRVVKRGKKVHGGHHGGAWKVAYADFVTAMMAFFLVMWIVGLSQTQKNAIAAYFQDPTGFMKAVKAGKLVFDENQGGKAPFKVKLNTPSQPIDDSGLMDADKKSFKRMKGELEKMIAASPEFKDIAESIRVNIVDEGLRIDLVESSADLFFDSGSATTKPRTKKLLGSIAKKLGTLPNLVVIEGHTDSRAYHGRNGWTNWELSTARANAARNVMEDTGLHAGQVLEVRGLADRMPLDPKNTASFKNRRVSILLPYRKYARYASPNSL